MGMVQINQIPGNIDLWLHSAWQPQIRRIWGWLHRFWSFAIPKDIRLSSVEALRLRLLPRIEPCQIMNELQCKMKAKSLYQPSKTVEALFTTAVVKIKADADKAIAKQMACSETEVVSAKAEDVDTAFEDVAEEKVEITAESQEPAAGEVSRSIQQMAQSQSNQPREQSLTGSGLCAKDVMLKEIVWGNPEDSVQQAITKMQQYDSGYLMVGIDGVLEGIASNSNITGALSPYLRPVFAKWRRPLDDATLQIRVKWIMSRPVRTVKPGTSLVTIIGNMCRFGQRAFPVVDEQGKVQGLVTAFGIFKVLSESTNISMVGKASEEHPLEQFDLGVGEKVQDAKWR